MPEPETLLKISNVSQRYDTGAGAGPVHVLKGVSLEVKRGESLAIIGPSGSGKSTLLNIIGTLDRATSGEVSLGGQDLNKLDDGQLAAVRNRQIGFVFQAHFLLPQCSVIENVLVPTLAKTLPQESSKGVCSPERKESSEERAHRLLNRVGLGERLVHRPGQLSGGERQRV